MQDHLETELEKIPEHGLDPWERVLIAARRVGAPSDLQRAYLEAEPGRAWQRRIVWMVLGMFALWILPKAMLSVLGPLSFWLMAEKALAPSLVSFGLVAAYGVVWITLVAGVWRLSRGRTFSGLSAINRWIIARPLVLFSGLIGATVLLTLFAPFVNALLLSFGSVKELETVVRWQAVSQSLSALFVPSILALIAWRCYPARGLRN
ncbi:MAG: hypothetical protein AAGE65_02965 [Planctomycetota bacterium]